jgi:hypothetical protein
MKPGKLRQHADALGVRAAVWIEPEHADTASVWTRADQQTHKDVAMGRIAEVVENAVASRAGGEP